MSDERTKLDECTLMVYVAWAPSRGDQRFVKHWTSADMGCLMPEPSISQAEMQPIVHAAKMALAKVLRDRKRRRKVETAPEIRYLPECTNSEGHSWNSDGLCHYCKLPHPGLRVDNT